MLYRLTRILILSLLALLVATNAVAAKKAKDEGDKKLSPLDLYVRAAKQRGGLAGSAPAAGSLWSPTARLYDVASDLRASRLDDTVTILVREDASAVSQGSVDSKRDSSASANIPALAGIPSAAGALQNLLDLSASRTLQGQGATSRRTTLSTTMTARVTDVLPNGFLVIEGTKSVAVNSENQLVTIRGVVRPTDIGTGNVVLSDHIAQLEVAVTGKGVVGDAIRRPNFLYRLLLGILPF